MRTSSLVPKRYTKYLWRLGTTLANLSSYLHRKLPNIIVSHYITTHDASRKAVFSPLPPARPSPNLPLGSIQVLSSTHTFPVNLSTESDITQYQTDQAQPSFPGTRIICPDNGTATLITTLNPGAESPMHRTMTLDVVVILEGAVELRLDSVVQRATKHKWVNVTPDGGVARWVVFVQAAAETVEVGGRRLEGEWDS